MMEIIKRRLPTVAMVFLGGLVLGLALEGYTFSRMASYNALIARLGQGEEMAVPEDVPAQVLLAHARFLSRQGRYDEALELFNRTRTEDKSLRALVYYNLGNLYLTQAFERLEAGMLESAIPLVELAKEVYREALRLDSHLWDAKYNLEVALHLVPELERIDRREEDEAARQEGHMWSDIPGFPRGLP